MSRLTQVLVVDDDPSVLRAVRKLLPPYEFHVESLTDPQKALGRLQDQSGYPVDVALFDLLMPEMTGLQLLHQLKLEGVGTEILLMTGHADVHAAVAAFKGGARDFLIKPFDSAQLIASVRQAAEQRRRLMTTPREVMGLLGRSPAVRDVMRLIEMVAPSGANVLIHGESGTGKELVARAVHGRSQRCRRPFVAVNCSSLSEAVLESELFGHTRGAYTGATSAKKGLFAAACGGTLFLDEIGELSPTIQVKLLRALQDGEIRPVGHSHVFKVDVRLIAATHLDLQQALSSGRIRPDLYYRLAVISVYIPPLREHMEDVPLLAHHFLRCFAAQTGKAMTGIDPDALRLLCSHGWPGNVRELENVIERALVLGSGPTLTAADLPTCLLQGDDQAALPETLAPRQPDFLMRYHDGRELALLSFERSYLGALLQQTQGNLSECARRAGIDRSCLRRILQRCGIATAEFRQG